MKRLACLAAGLAIVLASVAQGQDEPMPAPEAAAETMAPGAESPAPAADAGADAGAYASADAGADAGYASADAAVSQEPESGFFGALFKDMDFNIGGFIRPEAAFATGDENPYNQGGNPYNGVAVRRQAGDPNTNYTTTIPVSDSISRPIDKSDNTFNYHILRGELEAGLTFTSDLKLIGRLRAIYDPGHYDEFDARSVENMQGGIDGGDPSLYRGEPNYFEYRVEGDSSPNPLEWAGRNYMVYLPALFLDYNHGPLNVRAGNQQIAWGQALFFRVFDVVNGLDLRRHSILDYAQEEYADKRVPSLALRTGYQLTDALLVDSFVQKFQPTVYGNPGTPYNVIPVQFTIHDRYAEGGYDDKLSYGLRLKGNYGQWGFQAMAVRRYNPDGVFRWTASGVNKNLPNDNPLGQFENTINNGVTGPSTGELLAQTPFEASSGGVYSADEWFHYAAAARLDGVTALNAAIDEHQPAAGSLLARPAPDFNAAHNELDTFFIAAGGSMRGHLAREYFAENVFGLGASYVVEGEPGSIFDQLIINLETSYTPNRTFTAPSLSRDYLREDNSITALVMEKYYRFTDAFPATYFVFQAMHRTKDDLFGRSLKGYGGTGTSTPDGLSGGSNYVVLAFQQPLPQDIFRIGFATLYDPRGGLLVQPGFKWKPRGSMTVEAFYTYINGDLYGNPNDNVLSTADFADELTVRLGYQF